MYSLSTHTFDEQCILGHLQEYFPDTMLQHLTI